MRSNDGEHQNVAEDVHRQVPGRSHSIGAAHVLQCGRVAAPGSNGTSGGGEAMWYPCQ